MDMLPSPKVGCHRTGFAKTCRSLVTSGKCNRWCGGRFLNEKTGEEFDRYDCVDNWLLVYARDNAQLQNQTGAAIEKFRNEMILLNEQGFAAVQSVQNLVGPQEVLPAPMKTIPGEKK